MPYRKAWIWLLALLALTFVAFWPGYFSKLPTKKIAHHYHAASAMLWMLLALAQSWTIHNNQLALHRKIGPAIFLLFPFFLIAGVWVIHVEAGTVASDFSSVEGKQLAQFGFFDPLANIGFAALFWGGLRYRTKVHQHARYMLGTVMFVVAPVFWRMLENYVPMFAGAEAFDMAFAVGNLGALAIALGLYRHAPKHGRAFLLVAGIISAQIVLFLTVGKLPGWGPIFGSVASINLPLLLTLTGIVSLGIAWHGWVAGSRPVAPRAAAAV